MRGYKRNKKLKVKLIAFTLLFLQLANPLAMYADDKYPVKTLKYTTPESEVDTNEMTLTIPIKNLKEVKDIRVKNGGAVEILSQDSKGVKVKLTGNNNPRKVLKKNKYSKNVNESEEKSTNSFDVSKSVSRTENHPAEGNITYSGNIPKSGSTRPKKYTKNVTAQTSSNYSDSQGFSGNLTRYVYSGSYTPSDTKHVTNQTSQNYNSGGYSGTLTRYLHSGKYTPERKEKDEIIRKAKRAMDLPDTVQKDGRTYEKTAGPYKSYETVTVTKEIKLSKGYYSENSKGEVTYDSSTFAYYEPSTGEFYDRYYDTTVKWQKRNLIYPYGTPDEREYDRYVPVGATYKDGKFVAEYECEYTVPASDTRVYRYQGNVTKPSSDTRTYRYRGDVHKTTYTQNYEGNIYADGYDRYYKYDLEIDHTLLNVEEPTVTYNNKDWTNKDLNINVIGNEVNRVKEIRYRLDGKEWEILPSEGGNIKIKDVSKLEIQSISNERPELNSPIKEIFIENIDKQKPKIIIKR